MNGGTMRFQSTSAAVNVDNSIATTANGGTLYFRANSTFNPPAITGTGRLTLTGDSGVTVTTLNFQGFAGTLNLGTGSTNFFRLGNTPTGYVESSLKFAAVNLAAGAQIPHQGGTSGTLTTEIGTLSGANGSFIGGSGSGGGTIVFQVGARNEPSTFAGTITNGGTKSGLTKVGSAKLTLTNYNTYTGPTRVSGGILSITNAYLPNTAAVTVDAGAVLDLNFDDTDFVGSLSLGGSAPLPDGIYNSTTPGYEAFFSGPGSLRVGVTGFSTWSATYVGGQSPSLDFDKDGVSNGIEYFFGETTPVFTTNPGIVTTGSVRSVTWPMSGSYTGTYKVETSPNLVTWTDVTGAAVVDSGTLTYTLPSSEPKLFVRLTVVPE
jgi:autotransporter-associated beta strand protein